MNKSDSITFATLFANAVGNDIHRAFNFITVDGS